MSEIALQLYLEEVNRLIEESRLVEAAAHCRHILEQHPRHVETYRLLGKALLEQGKFDGATDVFQRVLSAAPDDFIAHAAMAIVYKGEDDLKTAAWHMERAFEMDPYNVAVRETLSDLNSRRDGRPPEQVTLTRGALARLYVRGELYDQAISELQRLLGGDGDRIDLEVLLAEALWRDEQRVDAVELCTGILERLPDCIIANAILAEVWLLTDRVDEAQVYLRRVFDMALPTAQGLDEDSPIGRAYSIEGAMSLPEVIMVESLPQQVAMGIADDGDMEEAPDLADGQESDTGELEWLDAFVSADDSESDFDWLREVGAPEGDEPQVTGELDAGDLELATEPEGATSWFPRSSDQLPGMGGFEEETDWEAWLESEQQPDEGPALGSQDDSSELEEVHMSTMDDMGKNHEEFPEGDGADSSGAERPEENIEDADWLDELGKATPDPDEVQSEDQEDDLPDWLTDDATLIEGAEQGLDWLGDEEEEKSADLEDAGEAPGGQLPDWLQEEMEEPVDEPEAADDEDLSWLDQIAAGEGAAIDEPPTMSWPESESGDPSEDQASETSAGPQLEVEASGVGAAEPADQDSAGEVDEVPEDLEEAMAWLEQLAAQQGAPVEELPSLEQLSEEDEEALLEEMPDDLDQAMRWLEELSEQERTADVGVDEWPADDVPEETSPGVEAQEPEHAFEDDWLEELAQEEDVFATESEAEDVAGPGDVEEPVDWLDELAAEEEVAAAEPEAWAGDEDQASDEESADWPEELTRDEADAVSPELGEALEGEREFEEPFVQDEDLESAVDEQDVSEAPEDLDDAMAWLEQLAADQGVPADELPSLQDVDKEEELTEEVPAFEEAEAELAEPEDVEMPDDDLAWLEGLEEDVDETWLDESVADAEAALDSSDVFERPAAEDAPEEEDEAMAWLEELASRQGASPDELPSLDALSVSEEMEAQSLEELDEIPDDPEEALAWLESLAGEREDAEEGAEVVEEEATPSVPYDVAAARAEAEVILRHEDLDEDDLPEDSEILDDMPDDPDEAMAWLEQLAARQGAPLDELPSVEGVEEDVEVPDWLEEEQEVAEDVEPSLPEGVAEVEPEAVSDEDVAEAEESPDEFEEAEAEPAVAEADAAAGEAVDAFYDLDETVDEDDEPLPDWLTLDDEDELEEVDWEEPVAGVSDWLQAEEVGAEQETMISDVEEPSTIGPEADPILEVPEQEEPVEVPDVAEPSERPQIPETMNADRLQAARQALDSGDLEAAETAYRQTLEEGENLSFLITELEVAVEAHPRLQQLLGDVYMRNGQLQKALDAYRGALKSL